MRTEIALFVGGPLHGQVKALPPNPEHRVVRSPRIDRYDPLADEVYQPMFDEVGYERQRFVDLDGEPVVLMVCKNPGRFERRSLIRAMWEVVT